MAYTSSDGLDEITYRGSVEDRDECIAPNDPLVDMLKAYDLTKKGYRRTSNKYCIVARIDRDDWVEVLAKQRHCSVADFYSVDGSGIPDNHRDHYIRVFSQDQLTVSPSIYKLMKRYR